MSVEVKVTESVTPFAEVKPEDRTPVMVHCRDCRHEWAAFYFPLLLDKKGLRLMKNAAKACPRCAGDNIYMGNCPPTTIAPTGNVDGEHDG